MKACAELWTLQNLVCFALALILHLFKSLFFCNLAVWSKSLLSVILLRFQKSIFGIIKVFQRAKKGNIETCASLPFPMDVSMSFEIYRSPNPLLVMGVVLEHLPVLHFLTITRQVYSIYWCILQKLPLLIIHHLNFFLICLKIYILYAVFVKYALINFRLPKQYTISNDLLSIRTSIRISKYIDQQAKR